jgi:protein TonB
VSVDARRVGFIGSAVLHAGVVGALLLPGTTAVTSAPAERVMELSLEMFEVARAEPTPVVETAAPPAPSTPPPKAVPAMQARSVASELPLRQTVNAPPRPTRTQAEPSVDASKRPLPRKVVDDRPRRRVTRKPVESGAPAPAKRPMAPARPAAPRRAAAAVAASPRVSPDRDRLREAYLADLIGAIHRHKFYPRKSRRRAEQGTVVVAFTIERDGGLTAIAVKRSSGIRRLDEAALETLRKLASFRPIPSALRGDRWPMSVPIEFRLR